MLQHLRLNISNRQDREIRDMSGDNRELIRKHLLSDYTTVKFKEHLMNILNRIRVGDHQKVLSLPHLAIPRCNLALDNYKYNKQQLQQIHLCLILKSKTYSIGKNLV